MTLEGSMRGTYVRTTGEDGIVRPTISTAQTESAVVEVEVRRQPHP